jgi:uncharacterized protein YjeT (DUF2065 family)
MIALAKLIGIFITCMGIIVIVKPQIIRMMISFWRQDKRIYLGGLLRMLFGAIFLLSAPQARLPVVMAALGLFLLIAGLLIFLIKLDKIKSMLERWSKRPSYVLRLMGSIVLIIGLLIIYSV